MEKPTFHAFAPTVIYQAEVHNKEIIKEIFFKNFEKYGFDIDTPDLFWSAEGVPVMPVGYGFPAELDNKVSEVTGIPGDYGYSVTGEFRGKGFIHLDPEFKIFFDQLKKHLYGFFNGLNLDINKFSFHVIKSWYTIINDKTGVSMHSHSSSDLSFVYYVDVPDGSGNIHFINPNYHDMCYNSYFPGMFERPSSGRAFMNDVWGKEYNAHTNQYFALPSIEGTLLIFPSKLAHMVPQSKDTEEKRFSISGDIKLCLDEKIDDYEHGLVHPCRWLELK